MSLLKNRRLPSITRQHCFLHGGPSAKPFPPGNRVGSAGRFEGQPARDFQQPQRYGHAKGTTQGHLRFCAAAIPSHVPKDRMHH